MDIHTRRSIRLDGKVYRGNRRGRKPHPEPASGAVLAGGAVYGSLLRLDVDRNKRGHDSGPRAHCGGNQRAYRFKQCPYYGKCCRWGLFRRQSFLPLGHYHCGNPYPGMLDEGQVQGQFQHRAACSPASGAAVYLAWLGCQSARDPLRRQHFPAPSIHTCNRAFAFRAQRDCGAGIRNCIQRADRLARRLSELDGMAGNDRRGDCRDGRPDNRDAACRRYAGTY